MSSDPRPRAAGGSAPEPHGTAAEVAVVVASIEARATIAASLRRFVEEAGARGEVVLVDASSDGTADEAERTAPSVRVVRQAPGRLAPELWAEGLRVTRAPLVAFSTAQMIPSPGWLAALRDRLEAEGAAVAGGPIEPSRGLSAADRALYLQRYVHYMPPLPEPAGGRVEPPGDNALYRREALAGLEPLWERGFWEVEVHRQLRQRGARLAMAADAVVRFHGGTRLGLAVRQRQAHARHYAADRARQMRHGERLGRSAAAPIVPAILLRRIAATLAARGQAFRPWLAALAPLSLLLAAWSIGEAAGTWLGPPGKR